MSAETDVLDDQTAHEETVLLEWTVHLRRRSPEKARLVFASMAFSAFLGWLQFHALIFVLVGPLMIFTATAEYLLPIRYRLTSRRACAAYGAARLEIEWDRIKRADLSLSTSSSVAVSSIKLSPFAVPNRLDAFRGVVLRFAPDEEKGNREEVLQLLEEKGVRIVSSAEDISVSPSEGTSDA